MTTDPHRSFRQNRVIFSVAKPDRQAQFSLLIWFGYLFFVAYGSLVPLDFRPLPFDQAWSIFQHLPMYVLDIDSRADWIANVVLSIPTGFLTAHLLLGKFFRASRILLLVLSGLFSFAFVISIEFAQIYFPPRTCSLNDIIAQTVGGLIGLLLAAKYSAWFKGLLCAGSANPRRRVLRLLEAYLVGYLAFCLFPYDVVFSAVELEQKLRGGYWGWWLAGPDLHGGGLATLKLLFEIILTLPFGVFLGYRSASRSANFKQAILLGILLGSCIEIAQFFIASGISEGFSVLTRIVGVCAGLALWKHRTTWTLTRLVVFTQRYRFLLWGIYLLVLLQVNGWFSHSLNAVDIAILQLGELHFIPFYYHYFASEAKALFSVAVVALMYVPIGLLVWANRGGATSAFFYALFVASFVEISKLFLQGMRADPTNVLLGAFTGWGVVHLAQIISAAASAPLVTEIIAVKIPDAQQAPPIQDRSLSGNHVSIAGKAKSCWKVCTTYIVLLPCLAFSAYWAATFPTQPVLLCLFLATCAAAIWHKPVWLVAIIPAALPVLDMAQWSGRFYLDEFDLLLLVSLAIGYARVPCGATNSIRYADKLLSLACGLVAISFLLSAMRGLLPWHVPDANAFNNYYSPFNALRIVKGALWAFLTYRLLHRMAVSGADVKRSLTIGMVIGLALTVAVILWERLTFSGLFNFSSDYRVTGPFSVMHMGGAYIECFLALAAPFLVLLILQTKNWGIKALGVTLLLATTYSLMVTFSRNGYSAFGIALAIILFFAAFKSGRWQQRSLLVTALSAAMLAVAIPVFTGQFAQDRIATIGKDYAVREAHWGDALDIRSPNWLTTLFGVGLGRYPESHYLLSREDNRSGTYQVMSEAGDSFLRLVSGSSIYMGQRVSVEPQQKYLLKLDARSNKPDTTITIPICEKWLISSYNCIWVSFDIGKEVGAWHHFERLFSADQLNISHWYSQRPIKLSLYNGNLDATVDVGNVKLETTQGESLLLNGDFSKELDHWFFTADSHLQWHIKSLPVAVLFDQGWFGLIALSLFSMLALMRATGRAWHGDLSAATVLAAFSGFLVVGLFDTLIDAPRFLFLLLMLGGLCGFRDFAEPRVRQHE